MTETPSDLDISAWSAADAHRACFDAPPLGSAWDHPGAALVGRRLRKLVEHRARSDWRATGREHDLYVRVYDDLCKRFEHIWESFRRSQRPKRWDAWEAYLQTALRNSLAKALESLAGREAPRDGPDRVDGAEASDETLDRRHLVDRALAALSGDERDALNDLRLHGRSAANTARRLGLSVGAVYNINKRAYPRFRHEVVRILGEELMRSFPEDSLIAAIVNQRCRRKVRCLAFKRDCRSAQTPGELGALVGANGPDEVGTAFDLLEREISRALAERGAPRKPDECIWETRPEPDTTKESADHE